MGFAMGMEVTVEAKRRGTEVGSERGGVQLDRRAYTRSPLACNAVGKGIGGECGLFERVVMEARVAEIETRLDIRFQCQWHADG